jgi:putative transposase
MQMLGVEAISPPPKLSQSAQDDERFPYLLRDLTIAYPDQMWESDITYIRMTPGFLYFVAIMDWYSRDVVSWSVSTTVETSFCLEALQQALQTMKPEIVNSAVYEPSIYRTFETCEYYDEHG